MPFVTTKFVPNDARTTIVAITSYENKNPVGTVYNPYFGEAFAFNSLTELLLSIDAMLDELELPKSAMNTRSFTPAAHDIPLSRAKRPEAPLATFKLKVLFRQNASWQGNLAWVEGNSEAPFRSVFELICLADSALIGNATDT